MRRNTKAFIQICLLIIGVIMIMLFVNMAILTNNNIRKANEYAKVMIRHIQDQISERRSDEDHAEELIRRDYISSADTVAYILDSFPESGKTTKELQEMAEKVMADEINIINTDGVITASSSESNVGFDFRAEAPGYLDNILQERSGKEFERITKNTPSGVEMAYASCWCEDRERLALIGINKTRYDSIMSVVGISQLIKGIVLSEGTRVYVASSGSYIIVGSSDGELIGSHFNKTGARVNNVALYDTYFFSASILGVDSYCAVAERNGYYVLIAQEKQVVNGGVVDSSVIMFVYLCVAGLSIAFLMRSMTKKLMAEEERANRDNMTGFLNRRAYETQMISYASVVPSSQNFTLAAFDLNGLKVINDSKGHDAGDELIRGGAECIMTAFGQYGKLYRVGGDEFMGILDINAETLDDRKRHFEKLTSEWRGQKVIRLAVSAGFVSHAEFPDRTVRELEKLADERMYRAKDKFYQESGQDRRRPR